MNKNKRDIQNYDRQKDTNALRIFQKDLSKTVIAEVYVDSSLINRFSKLNKVPSRKDCAKKLKNLNLENYQNKKSYVNKLLLRNRLS